MFVARVNGLRAGASSNLGLANRSRELRLPTCCPRRRKVKERIHVPFQTLQFRVVAVSHRACTRCTRRARRRARGEGGELREAGERDEKVQVSFILDVGVGSSRSNRHCSAICSAYTHCLPYSTAVRKEERDEGKRETHLATASFSSWRFSLTAYW